MNSMEPKLPNGGIGLALYEHTMDACWVYMVETAIAYGAQASPRGNDVRELYHTTFATDMAHPVLTIPGRKLSYQFMAAEAFWILTGDETVKGIAPWNKNISKFSDDGERFFGAYGPKILSQLDYVVDKLIRDPFSRQAGLTIWRENPPESKDIPCTVSIFFDLRNNELNTHVFMRSSDVWLGLPYDVFNFSMLGHLVCARLNSKNFINDTVIKPGKLFLTAANTHIYESDMDKADECIESTLNRDLHSSPPVPRAMYLNEDFLFHVLKTLRDTNKGHEFRWWEKNNGQTNP